MEFGDYIPQIILNLGSIEGHNVVCPPAIRHFEFCINQ